MSILDPWYLAPLTDTRLRNNHPVRVQILIQFLSSSRTATSFHSCQLRSDSGTPFLQTSSQLHLWVSLGHSFPPTSTRREILLRPTSINSSMTGLTCTRTSRSGLCQCRGWFRFDRWKNLHSQIFFLFLILYPISSIVGTWLGWHSVTKLAMPLLL